MIFGHPGKPTKIKKIIYLALSAILGVFLSFLAHAVIEMGYLNWAEKRGLAVTFYGGCALPPLLQTSLWIFGIIGGLYLGRWWWRKLYIERVWEKK